SNGRCICVRLRKERLLLTTFGTAPEACSWRNWQCNRGKNGDGWMFRRSEMEPPLAPRNRLSLNQITTRRWSVREAAEACARRGIPAIALWRDKIAEQGLDASVHAVREAGLRVSSVCRGGMFPAVSAEERRARIEE